MPASRALLRFKFFVKGDRAPNSDRDRYWKPHAAQARMKKPRPTNDRGSACQTIWCRHASGMAGLMAPFSASVKAGNHLLPDFVYASFVLVYEELFPDP
jgi:hypothetical protein